MTTPVTHVAKDDAQTVAAEAGSQAQNVAGEARSQAQNVAAEATQQARDLAGEAQAELRQQADTQRDRAVSTLRELGQELREMADGGNRSGLASDLARRASDQVNGVGGYLEGRGPGDLLDDLRSLARRRPGAFLLGAAAAGVLAGRATRGVRAASSSGGHDAATSPDPLSGNEYPPVPATTTGVAYPPPEPATGPAYATPPLPGSTGTAAGRPLDGLETGPAFGLEPDPAARRMP